MYDIHKACKAIKDKITVNDMFAYYRLVDVADNKVYDWDGEKLIPAEGCCFDVWERDEACINCISQNCISENQRVFKMEALHNQVLFIVANPIVVQGKAFSLELIRDVTNELFLNDNHHLHNLRIKDIIDELNDTSVQDPFTRLYNKRYAEQFLKQAVRNWNKERKLVVAAINLKNARYINEHFSVEVGDEVISGLAELINYYAKDNMGVACRIDGDRFLIFFKNIEVSAVEDIVQTIKADYEATNFKNLKGEMSVSFTYGIVEYNSEVGNWERLLQIATDKCKNK